MEQHIILDYIHLYGTAYHIGLYPLICYIHSFTTSTYMHLKHPLILVKLNHRIILMKMSLNLENINTRKNDKHKPSISHHFLSALKRTLWLYFSDWLRLKFSNSIFWLQLYSWTSCKVSTQ